MCRYLAVPLDSIFNRHLDIQPIDSDSDEDAIHQATKWFGPHVVFVLWMGMRQIAVR